MPQGLFGLGGTHPDSLIKQTVGDAFNHAQLLVSPQGQILAVGTIPLPITPAPMIYGVQSGLPNAPAQPPNASTFSVGTSLAITSGTGTGAVLQNLTVNTIQGIRTTDRPTFAGVTLSNTVSFNAAVNNGLVFTGNSDVGNSIKSPAADVIAFTVGGNEVGRFNVNSGLLLQLSSSDVADAATLVASGTIAAATGTINATTLELFTVIGGAQRLVSGRSGASGTFQPLAFWTNNAEAMRIATTGNVTIGSTTSTSQFNVGTSAQFQVSSTGKLGIGVTPDANFLTKIDNGATPAYSQSVWRANGAGGISILCFSADNNAIGWDTDYSASNWTARHTSAYSITKDTGSLRIRGNSGLTIGNTYTPTDILSIYTAGSVVIGTGALATNATDGFFYISTSAGPPTGTPTTHTGRVALHYDTTNNNLSVFNGAWKKVGLT